jgi:hypothetical protein
LSLDATFRRRMGGVPGVERAVNGCALPHPGRRLTARVGTEASVSTLDDEGSLSCVKKFHPTTNPNDVRAEYEALRALHDALEADDRLRDLVSSPRPIHLCTDGLGYLMSSIDGEPFPVYAHETGAEDLASRCEALAAALLLFHEVTGRAYGDFHPGNVFVGSRTWMLDPLLLRQQSVPEAGGDPLAADLGYWWFHVALGVGRWRPSWVLPQFRGIRALVTAAAAETGRPRDDLSHRCLLVARAHLRAVRSRGGARRRLVYSVGKIVLWVSRFGLESRPRPIPG